MAIKIIGSGWEVNSTASTQTLAEVVYRILSGFIGYELECDIIVENDLALGYPLAHYEKKDGNWLITLSCASGMHWAQIAYQLSHEICHLYCNHAQSRGHKHKWLEESLCECASIAVLDKLGQDWGRSDMAKFYLAYDQSIIQYVDNLKAAVNLKLDNQEQFFKWLSAHIEKLESSSTLRDLNSVVALYLYDSLLEKSPRSWVAVTALNTWDCFRNKTFEAFIDQWLDNSRPRPTDLIQLLRS